MGAPIQRLDSLTTATTLPNSQDLDRAVYTQLLQDLLQRKEVREYPHLTVVLLNESEGIKGQDTPLTPEQIHASRLVQNVMVDAQVSKVAMQALLNQHPSPSIEDWLEYAQTEVASQTPSQHRPKALLFLGAHFWGSDPQKAIDYFKQSADAGCVEASVYLRRFYTKGSVVQANPAEAFKYTLKAAQLGHAQSQFDVAACYLTGDTTVQDCLEALTWFTEAGKQGVARAYRELGILHEFYNFAIAAAYQKRGMDYGNGDKPDRLQAFKYYHQAAEGGDVPTQKYLDYCKSKGDGLTKENIAYLEALKAQAAEDDEVIRTVAEASLVLANYNFGLDKDLEELQDNYRQFRAFEDPSYVNPINEPLSDAPSIIASLVQKGFSNPD